MSEDNFENGIFWEIYIDLERQLEDFLEYVPYLSGNEKVYSFRLLNLLLGIGGYVDSAFKEMAKYERFANNTDCQEILRRVEESEENIRKGERPSTVPIWLSLRAFETEYKLSRKEVLFKRLPEREPITPFKPFDPNTNAPEWWGFYNGLKHNISKNLESANLCTAVKALAGAFLLNARHDPSALRLYEYGVFRVRHLPSGKDVAANIHNEEILRQWLEKREGTEGYVETPLFIYDSSQGEKSP
jgi:hypothetical protein